MIKHLVCIMDGNRRWAAEKGMLPWQGHKAGAEKIEMVIDFCIQQKISYLSLYTFSLENFKRPELEKKYLFDLIVNQTEQYIDRFVAKGIRINFIGDLSLFPKSVQKMCHNAVEKTKNQTVLFVNFLFGYGGQQEIFAAACSMAHDLEQGKIVTQDEFKQYLWTANMPYPDLIIRTGGVDRLSNCLLYQSAYAQICFLETLWPDITQADLITALYKALTTIKNFGK